MFVFVCLVCLLSVCLFLSVSFTQVFSYLPMFTIVNDAVMVVHGGLFHTEDVLLSELNAIDRVAFSLKDLPDGGEKLAPFPRYQSFALYPREQVRVVIIYPITPPPPPTHHQYTPHTSAYNTSSQLPPLSTHHLTTSSQPPPSNAPSHDPPTLLPSLPPLPLHAVFETASPRRVVVGPPGGGRLRCQPPRCWGTLWPRSHPSLFENQQSEDDCEVCNIYVTDVYVKIYT